MIPGMERYFVTEAASGSSRSLHRGRTISACLDWIRDRWEGARGKPAIWVDHPPMGEGPDAFVCVPAWVLDARRDHAAEVVEAWEARWLLIASTPRAHREEARVDLVEAVAQALTAASQSMLAGIEEDVGF